MSSLSLHWDDTRDGRAEGCSGEQGVMGEYMEGERKKIDNEGEVRKESAGVI